MRIRVLFFAAFREAVGETEKEVDVAEHATLEHLFEDLSARYPGLRPLRPYTTFARNREVVPPQTVLHGGDEVAFLQPVSGGSA